MILLESDTYAYSVFKHSVNSPSSKVIGLTSGCFDMIHYHHLIYLERCKNMCDILIVGIDSDILVKESKGPDRPKISENRRMRMVDALKVVDIVFPMNHVNDWIRIVDDMRPDKLFKNENFDDVEVHVGAHGKIIRVPDIKEISSTTQLINSIKEEK